MIQNKSLSDTLSKLQKSQLMGNALAIIFEFLSSLEEEAKPEPHPEATIERSFVSPENCNREKGCLCLEDDGSFYVSVGDDHYDFDLPAETLDAMHAASLAMRAKKEPHGP